MLENIQIAYNSGKAIFDIAKGINSLSSEVERNQAVIEIQRHAMDANVSLMDAQQAYSAALKHIDNLEQQIVQMKKWSGEKERYQLKRFHPGSLAYALKPEMAGGEPTHLLCANCYENGTKSLLQATHRTPARYRLHLCPSCKSEFEIGGEMENSVGASLPAPAVDFASSGSETWKTV